VRRWRSPETINWAYDFAVWLYVVALQIAWPESTLRHARRLANRLIFLYTGELIEQGPTETIFTEPNDPRTKAYIEGTFG
jgi:ABC-type phosphate transport system ATPase subunit